MQPHLSALGLVCVFLGWNMPNHYPPYPSFHGELMTGIGMVFIALGRVGKPQDVARMVAFLCAEDPNFITGQYFVIDGFQWEI